MPIGCPYSHRNPSGRWTKRINARCFCGIEFTPNYYSLRAGFIKSCGCARYTTRATVLNSGKSNPNKGRTTHGLSKHPLFYVFSAMKYRCLHSKCKAYADYGGRGIIVCEEWVSDFSAFYNWAISNGWGIGLTIDRTNNDGNYEPSNCRWVTQSENMLNTRRKILIKHGDETKTLYDWAVYFGKTYSYLYIGLITMRLTMEAALVRKENKGGRKKTVPSNVDFSISLKSFLRNSGHTIIWLSEKTKPYIPNVDYYKLSEKISAKRVFFSNEEVSVIKRVLKTEKL